MMFFRRFVLVGRSLLFFCHWMVTWDGDVLVALVAINLLVRFLLSFAMVDWVASLISSSLASFSLGLKRQSDWVHELMEWVVEKVFRKRVKKPHVRYRESVTYGPWSAPGRRRSVSLFMFWYYAKLSLSVYLFFKAIWTCFSIVSQSKNDSVVTGRVSLGFKQAEAAIWALCDHGGTTARVCSRGLDPMRCPQECISEDPTHLWRWSRIGRHARMPWSSLPCPFCFSGATCQDRTR